MEEKKLARCWVGYFVAGQIRRELGIPDNVQVEAILPIGYSYEKKKSPRKTNIDNILYFEKYGSKKMGGPKGLDV